MKKIFIIMIMLAALTLFYFTRDNTVNVESGTSVNQGDAFRPDPSSATFTFDDEVVTLSRGRHADEDSAEETALLDLTAYGDLNADGKKDTIVLLARSSGGSGIFIYVAAYVSGPVNYKGSNAIFLGDRVAPQNIAIKDGVVTVSYLDRSPEEALASEPTIPASLQLIYRNGELQER